MAPERGVGSPKEGVQREGGGSKLGKQEAGSENAVDAAGLTGM